MIDDCVATRDDKDERGTRNDEGRKGFTPARPLAATNRPRVTSDEWSPGNDEVFERGQCLLKDFGRHV